MIDCAECGKMSCEGCDLDKKKRRIKANKRIRERYEDDKK